MSFLEINRIPIPVVNQSPARQVKRRGSRGRSFRGEVHDMSRGSRRSWTMKACFTDIESGYAEAEAFERLIQGEGHTVTFGSGLQASTGLNPLPGYSGMTWNAGAGTGQSPGYLDVAAGALLQYDAQLGDEWTILLRDYKSGSPGDEFDIAGVAVRSDGTAFYAGSGPQSAAAISSFSISVRDGILTLDDTDGQLPTEVDGLVILPYLATDAMLAVWTGVTGGTPIWGPLPSLRVTGQVIAEQHSYMVGEVTGVSYLGKPQQVSGNVTTQWITNAKLVDFTLTEVPSTYVRADVL